MGNVTYLGQRKTGGKATNDTPMSAPAPSIHDGHMEYVWDNGDVVPKSLHDERRRKRDEIERAAKDRI